MERYEEYKDSGVEWIGEIPAGWRVAALGRIARITNGCDPKTPGDIPVFGSSGQVIKTCGEYKLPPAILLGRKGTIDRPSYIKQYYWNVDTAFDINGASCTANLRFVYYVATQFDYQKFATNTAVPSMTQRDYESMRIPLPSASEQNAIAAYLDEKTAQIDDLVAETEKSIDLLEEYRKSVISEAVTKGLDPNAPMKDSGVEWIGEMPAHWRLVKASLLGEFTLGKMLDTSKQTGAYPAPYLSNKDVQWFSFNTNDLKQMDFTPTERTNYQILDGDVLVCEGGEVGRCAVWRGDAAPFYFQKALHRVRLNIREMLPEYFALQMYQKAKGTDFIEVRKGESTIAHLPGNQMVQLRMLVPPLAEQRAIAAYLDERTAAIDALVAEKRTLLGQLREYRKSLISEAVTGKFKVPGVD